MSEDAIVTRARHLRLFFCAELIGGAEYKNRWPVEELPRNGGWPELFERFFLHFARDFKDEVTAGRQEEADERDALLVPPPQLLEIHGDALTFTERTYTDPAQALAALRTAVSAFVTVVQSFDRDLESYGLGVRG